MSRLLCVYGLTYRWQTPNVNHQAYCEICIRFWKITIKNFKTTANLDKSAEITYFHGQNLSSFETKLWREFQTCNFLRRKKIDEWHAIWNGGQKPRLKYAWASYTYRGKSGSWHEKADRWIVVFLPSTLSCIECSEHQIPCLKI